jgi:hypothetical protein
MRKPSYKMRDMHPQHTEGTPASHSHEEADSTTIEVTTGTGGKQSWKKDKNTSPPNCDLFGKKKKKQLLSLPTPFQLDSDSIYSEEKSRAKKKQKKGDSTPAKNSRQRKKGVSAVQSGVEPRRTSGRIRNGSSPEAASSLPINEDQTPLRKRKLDEELVQLNKSSSGKRRSMWRKDSPEAAKFDSSGEHVVSKPSVRRKRLKIIFAGLEVPGQSVNSSGGLEEDRKRKTGNGLDFGCRSAKSEAGIESFRLERVVLENQVLVDERKVPVCGTCAVPYSPGQVFVRCEYCDGEYWRAKVFFSFSQGALAHGLLKVCRFFPSLIDRYSGSLDENQAEGRVIY